MKDSWYMTLFVCLIFIWNSSSHGVWRNPFIFMSFPLKKNQIQIFCKNLWKKLKKMKIKFFSKISLRIFFPKLFFKKSSQRNFKIKLPNQNGKFSKPIKDQNEKNLSSIFVNWFFCQKKFWKKYLFRKKLLKIFF